jgi:hypothetical protein
MKFLQSVLHTWGKLFVTLKHLAHDVSEDHELYAHEEHNCLGPFADNTLLICLNCSVIQCVLVVQHEQKTLDDIVSPQQHKSNQKSKRC